MTDRRLACLTVLALAPLARADFNGFGTLSPSEWSVNQADNRNAPTYDQPSGTLHLTTPATDERRSVFNKTPQSVVQFTASFTYQVLNSGAAFAGGCGAALVLQNDPAGALAVGSGSFAYGGLTKSAAVTLELYTSSSASGYYTGGSFGGGSPSTAPVGLLSGHPINVVIAFDGATLTRTLTDTVTGATFSPPPTIATNLLASLGGTTAYVGLTASTTGNQWADQYFSNFKFSAVPTPASVSLLGASGLLALRRRR